MSATPMFIRYSNRSNNDSQHPVKALRFDNEAKVPALVIEYLEDAGFFAEPHQTIAQLVVTPMYPTSGHAMIESLIEVFSVWNQVHIGYSLTEDVDRQLWMASEFTQPSRALCEPPVGSELLRQIGKLRFDYDCAEATEQYENMKSIKAEIDRLTDEVSRAVV